MSILKKINIFHNKLFKDFKNFLPHYQNYYSKQKIYKKKFK